VPNGTQPCTAWSVHPDMPTVQDLYNTGELAFLANIGSLIEPLTKAMLYKYVRSDCGDEAW